MSDNIADNFTNDTFLDKIKLSHIGGNDSRSSIYLVNDGLAGPGRLRRFTFFNTDVSNNIIFDNSYNGLEYEGKFASFLCVNKSNQPMFSISTRLSNNQWYNNF